MVVDNGGQHAAVHIQGPQSDEEMSPQQRDAVIAGLYQKGREQGRYRPHMRDAPETRTVQRGTETVAQEFDPVTGVWKDVAAGPKWDPASGAGQLTTAQQTHNQRIDEARAQLDRLLQQLPADLTLSQELQRLMTRTDPLTGRPILDHNSTWGQLAALARRPKHGGDPLSERYVRLVAELPLPPEDPAGASAPAGEGLTTPLATSPALPPQAAVDYLRANPTPEMRAFFDQKYGAGASSRYLGR